MNAKNLWEFGCYMSKYHFVRHGRHYFLGLGGWEIKNINKLSKIINGKS